MGWFSKALLQSWRSFMLKLVGSRFHFRRVVPVSLRPILGKSEIWISLGRAGKVEARRRAAELHGQMTDLFEGLLSVSDIKQSSKTLTFSPEEIKSINEKYVFKTDLDVCKGIIRVLEDTIEIHETLRIAEVHNARAEVEVKYQKIVMQQAEYLDRLMSGIKEVVIVAENFQARLLKSMEDLAQRLQISSAEKKVLRGEIDRLHNTLITTFTKTIETTASRPPSQSPTPYSEEALPIVAENQTKLQSKAPSPLLLSAALERFLNTKPAKSLETQRDTSRTVALFVQAFGDLPVREIDGKVSGDFRDVLFSLPASHGKRRNLSFQDEIDRAASQDVPLLSTKTVKNHFMRLSSLWNDLLRRDMVEKNPWSRWNFDLSNQISRRAWKQEEMNKLVNTPWPVGSIPNETFMGITMVAAYSGMRLGEISNLRNEDIQDVEGVPCFRICAHPEDNWSPKTDAGERIVPIHSTLLSWGLLAFQKANQKYLFSDLKDSRDGNRGADFSRAFSRYKMIMDLPPAVTFHGFRHTVSTLLRNQKSDIREIWIDALLGHESSHKSQGATTYLSGIDLTNLQTTVEAIQYPDFYLGKRL
ncbi:tyrosine-type recombinase/integrase [Gluconobacter cerinus]|nr:tyrosine-type recombinase/integrase [Gluconobacter cerinus]